MNRVFHISDPHLSRGDTLSAPGWVALERLVQAAHPDLIVNTGDIVREAPEDREDHAFAADRHKALGVEFLCVAGNHDIGDGPPAGAGPGSELTSDFTAFHGPAHWIRRCDAWSLVGVNAMLFGSGREAEAAEWDWLETALGHQRGRPIALFVHKPPFLAEPDETDTGSAAMPSAAKARLWSLAKRTGVRLIGCGHRHEYRSVLAEGVLIVWAPTTSMRLEESTPPLSPVVYPGVVEYGFVGQAVLHRPIPLSPAALNRPLP